MQFFIRDIVFALTLVLIMNKSRSLNKEYNIRKKPIIHLNLSNGDFIPRRLSGTNITTYAVHPGAVSTNLADTMKDGNCCFEAVWCCTKHMIKTPFHGAQTSIYCAIEDSIEHQSGLYYADCKEKKPHECALNPDDYPRLWALSLEMVGLPKEEEGGQEEPDKHSVVESWK